MVDFTQIIDRDIHFFLSFILVFFSFFYSHIINARCILYLFESQFISTRKVITPYVRNPGRYISFPIFIRKEIETGKIERKTKPQMSRLNDLLYRLNHTISR